MGIWRRSFWTDYWIALRRSGKDLRARQLAVRISFLFIYLIAVAIFYIIPAIALYVRDPKEGFWTACFYLVIASSGTIVAFLIRRSHRRQDEMLSFSFSERRRPASSDVVSPAVHEYLAMRAHIIAAMLVRAGSEIALRNSQPTAGTVITRQSLNAQLREEGLWDLLESNEGDLMRASDGGWPDDELPQSITWCEQLRLLRWSLGIDSEIAPLAHFPKVDFELGSQVLRIPEASLRTRKVLRSWDLRTERDIAHAYAVRIVAEMDAKGLIADAGAFKDGLTQVRTKSLGASTDLLVGSETIDDLSDSALRVLLSISTARARYASYLMDQSDALTPAPLHIWVEQTHGG